MFLQYKNHSSTFSNKMLIPVLICVKLLRVSMHIYLNEQGTANALLKDLDKLTL